MFVQVITERDILIDKGISAIHLDGENEIRELIKKLNEALFRINDLRRHGGEDG
jgi:hypothetical protein